MLYINTALLDFGSLSVSEFSDINEATQINLFRFSNLLSSVENQTIRSTAYALGRVNMILHDRTTRSVSIVNDYNLTDYDWNFLDLENFGMTIRDKLMTIERMRISFLPFDKNFGFKTYYYGKGILNQILDILI